MHQSWCKSHTHSGAKPQNMGRKRNKKGKIDLDIVVKGRNFPLFPHGFQHSTSVLHRQSGKDPPRYPFHKSSTAPSPEGDPRKIPAAPGKNRVFHTIPSPYYCYYNKYNKAQPEKPFFGGRKNGDSGENELRSLWPGPEAQKAPSSPAGRSKT